ncbi:gliding motility-associated C-terminal domain-containing protein [Inquilinus sp. KBS0705]|nr:gliding motility-associated C-terminal domain-containing protein [Inquilinus sp. KBS0705]
MAFKNYGKALNLFLLLICAVAVTVKCLGDAFTPRLPLKLKPVIITKVHVYPPLVVVSTNQHVACENTAFIYTASVTYGGLNPVYKWQLNGVSVGGNSPKLTINNTSIKIKPGDVVRCIVKNSENNLSGTSNSVTGIYTYPYATPTIRIYDLTYPPPLCSGDEITIGSEISGYTLNMFRNYRLLWYINGVFIRATDHTGLVVNTVKNGDVITCELITTGECYISTPQKSNRFVVNLQPDAAAARITIATNTVNACAGSALTYKATVANGGERPKYQWIVNGQNVGTNSDEYTATNLQNGDKVSCSMLSSVLCSAGPVLSNQETVSVKTVSNNSVSITSTAVDNYIKANEAVTFTAVAANTGNVNYQWQVNGVNEGLNSANYTRAGLTLGDKVTCIISEENKCVTAPVSNTITILIKLPIVIPNTFTPNADGVNDTWEIKALVAYPGSTVSIFNRSGQQIYHSVDYSTPWNGTYNNRPIPAGTYYYIIDVKNGSAKLSGYVTVLR